MSEAYVIHTNFNEILSEIEKLQNVDKNLMDKVTSFVNSVKKISLKLEPAMKAESHDSERKLWQEYQQLQQEKLALLDLSHEWEHLEKDVNKLSQNLNFLIKDAVKELKEHLAIIVETHRAHIDILEIRNTRRIAVIALTVTAIISYIAVWEFFVRDLLSSIVFPYSLTPSLNYLLVIVTLLPVFVTVLWAWVRREAYF